MTNRHAIAIVTAINTTDFDLKMMKLYKMPNKIEIIPTGPSWLETHKVSQFSAPHQFCHRYPSPPFKNFNMNFYILMIFCVCGFFHLLLPKPNNRVNKFGERREEMSA